MIDEEKLETKLIVSIGVIIPLTQSKVNCFCFNSSFCDFKQTELNMQNASGEVVDLYIPRKWYGVSVYIYYH